MGDELKYNVKDSTLIIENCPSVLTREILDSIRAYKYESIELCEGIEEIEDSAFIDYRLLERINLPNSLTIIGKSAFCGCSELKEIILPDNVEEIKEFTFYGCICLKRVSFGNNLKIIGNKSFGNCSFDKIDLPDSVTIIDREAFSTCFNLRNIKFPLNLKKIGKMAFRKCASLRDVKIYDMVDEIGDSAFEGCAFLKNINIPSNVKEIKNRTFYGCDSLCNISFPDGLQSIGTSAFENCRSIKYFPILNNLIEIGDSAFYNCSSLEDVKFANSVEKIGAGAFAFCSYIRFIFIPDSVYKIGREAFFGCARLQNVVLSSNIKIIENGTFENCKFLKNINIPNGVVEIRSNAFKGCDRCLEQLYLPESLRKIGECAFYECSSLREIVIPEGVKEIPNGAFALCGGLESVTFPSTLETFDRRSLSYCEVNLNNINLNTKAGIKCFDYHNIYFVDNTDYKFMVFDKINNKYSFYINGDYVEFNMGLFNSKYGIKKMLDNRIINSDNYIRLYYWNKKKYVPSVSVIKNMPIKDVDKFYINDNGHVWENLIKKAKLSTVEGIGSFFKLCYVLGIFSESTSIRDRAVEFLNNNIIGVLYEFAIHSKFDGFDLSNGFNEEYAQFFIKYYNNLDFMIYTDEFDNEVDLMAASYNNFKNVKKMYPNKTLHTNRQVDILLPLHVMNAVKRVYYYNVDNGNENLALIVGGYGYSQEQFEKIQSYYNIAKNIDVEKMKLFVSNDNDEGITYELLNKTNPLNAVLGNITNCCQVVGGVGESCVEYGITKPNSGFVTFNYNNKIIGQAWVWYDEGSGTICLDNIEVPRRYSEKIAFNKDIQKSFVDCLFRLKRNFEIEMNRKGLMVNRVTVGQGYNDIKSILDKHFDFVKFSDTLSDYSGYSDAKLQYEITLKKQDKKGIR